MADTKRPLNRCSNCNHTWYPRGRNRSAKCPNCGSRGGFGTSWSTGLPKGCSITVFILIAVILVLPMLKLAFSVYPITTTLLLILSVGGYFSIRYYTKQKTDKAQQEIIEKQQNAVATRQAYLLTKFNNDSALVQRILDRNIELGDSKSFVLEAFGHPLSIDSDVLKSTTQEVWKYKKGNETGHNQYNVHIKFENDVIVGWNDKNES